MTLLSCGGGLCGHTCWPALPLQINGYSFKFSGDTTVIDLEISGPKGRRSSCVFFKDMNGKTEGIRTIIGNDLRPLDQSLQNRKQKPYIST
jgi:hypothetical protein